MSANVYSIENLLVGKIYRSKTLTGEIISAQKDDRAIWYGDECEPYLVEVRTNTFKNAWRTIAVKVGA